MWPCLIYSGASHNCITLPRFSVLRTLMVMAYVDSSVVSPVHSNGVTHPFFGFRLKKSSHSSSTWQAPAATFLPDHCLPNVIRGNTSHPIIITQCHITFQNERFLALNKLEAILHNTDVVWLLLHSHGFNILVAHTLLMELQSVLISKCLTPKAIQAMEQCKFQMASSVAYPRAGCVTNGVLNSVANLAFPDSYPASIYLT